MPRPRAGYVRTVTIPLTEHEKRTCRAAAGAEDRTLTNWVTRIVRRAIDAAVQLPAKEPRAGGRLDLELPGQLVDELAATVGPRNVGRYIRHVVLSAAAVLT